VHAFWMRKGTKFERVAHADWMRVSSRVLEGARRVRECYGAVVVASVPVARWRGMGSCRRWLAA
jgi:hypothetical protein